MNTPRKRSSSGQSKIDSGIQCQSSAFSTATSTKGSFSTSMTNANGSSSNYDGSTVDSIFEKDEKENIADQPSDLFNITLPETLTLPTFNFDLSALSILKDKTAPQTTTAVASPAAVAVAEAQLISQTLMKKTPRKTLEQHLSETIEKEFSFRNASDPYDGASHASYFKSRSEPLDNVTFGFKKPIIDQSNGTRKKHQTSSIFQELDSVFDTSCYDVSMYKKKRREERTFDTTYSSLTFDPAFNSTKVQSPTPTHSTSRNFCDTSSEIQERVSNTPTHYTNTKCDCKKQLTPKATQTNGITDPKPPTSTNVQTNLNTDGRELVITITVKLPE